MFWNKGLKFGNSYGVQAGDYAGELLIYIEEKDNSYGFLSIPKMTNRYVPIEKFKFAIEENLIEFVERVPGFVRKTAKAQYTENK